MPKLLVLVTFVLLASLRPAVADPELDPVELEVGVYTGGFISNFYHQFYDIRIQNRPLLDTVNPEAGLRFAYFPIPWLGAEAEASWIMAHTNPEGDLASIFGVRGQIVAQYLTPPWTPRIVPYVALGIGVDHISSPMTVLGDATHFPIHAGGGFRIRITDQIAIRLDGRFLRGPSEQAPYTLNASYGEFMLGVSFVPSFKPSGPRIPRVDGDADGDGIPDSQDKCPNEPEDKDMFEDQDGCPDIDNDRDGIPDSRDKCPLDPEDYDGFQDADGCPDKDNDGDGIPDLLDKCPNEPEDKDGFQDLDGCPDPDNDGDGIPDEKDKCPNEPETINGVQDDDGCPDKGDALVILSPDRLELLESIQFNGVKIAKASFNLLGQIAATLRAHGEIVRLRVTVHVQPTRDADRDQEVSDKRAAAVRDWLVQWGIATKRLEPRGFGGSKPLVPADQRGAAAINERIDLIILERR